MKITRHFSVTTTVVHNNKVLLHFHKKLNKWIPIGGHIEENELPEEAAVREAKEEAGIDIELYNPDKKLGLRETRQLICPARMVLHDISEDHKHIDFTFYATCKTADLKAGAGESKNLKWFTKEEIENLDIIDNAKQCALEALETLGK